MTSTVPASTSRTQLTLGDWSLILLLAAVNFTHILDFVIIMPLGDTLRTDLGITPQLFSYVVSAYGFAAVIAGVVASSFVDRLDRRTMMLASFGGFIVATWYCGIVKDYEHLLVARGFAGLFGGIAASGVMAIIGDVFPPALRGRAIGAVMSSFAVASTIGLPIGLMLANRYDSWNAPFLAIAILGVFVWMLIFMRLPSLTGHRVGRPANPFRQFGAVVQQPNHLWSLAFMLATVLGTFIIVPFIAPFYVANCGLTEDDIPYVYFAAGICTLFMVNATGWLTDKIGPHKTFLMAGTGAVIMTAITTNLPTINLAVGIIVTAAFMVLASGRMVPAQAMILRSADPTLRGAFMNLSTATTHFGTAIGPLISGAVIGEQFKGGPLTNYWVAGIIGMGFGVTSIVLSFFLQSGPAPVKHESMTDVPPLIIDPSPENELGLAVGDVK